MVEYFVGLPKTIKVGPFVYKTSLCVSIDNDDNIFGQLDSSNHEMKLRLSQPSAASAVDTVIHELTHALWRWFALHDDNKEEQVVSALATALTQAWIENPDLIKWISRTLKRN